MHRGFGLGETSLSSGHLRRVIGLTNLIDQVEAGAITGIAITAIAIPARIVRTTQVEVHRQVVVALRQAVVLIFQSARSIE